MVEPGNTLTLGTPFSGALPTDWTWSWVGTSMEGQATVLSWDNVGALVVNNGAIEVQLAPGTVLDGSDALLPSSEVSVVVANAGAGAQKVAVYIDAGAEVASTTMHKTETAAAPGALVVNHSNIDSVRVFNSAIDPTTADQFWLDEPGSPLPASLAAAYDFFTVPPWDRVAGQAIPGTLTQTMLTTGRIWPGTGGEIVSTKNFQPGAGGAGLTVQAWVRWAGDVQADFVIASFSGSSTIKFLWTQDGHLRLSANGTNVDAPTGGAVSGVWMNVAAMIGPSIVAILINGVPVVSQKLTVDTSNITGAQFGGWSSATSTGGAQTSIQTIGFYNGALTPTDVKTFMYSRSVGDPRCIGLFRLTTGNIPFNLITGDNVTADSGGQRMQFWEDCSSYSFPSPAIARDAAPAVELARPTKEEIHAFLVEASANAEQGNEQQQLTNQLTRDLRVLPTGELVLVGCVVDGANGGLALVTSRGLVAFRGLTFPSDAACNKWIAKLLYTLITGFAAMLGHFRTSSPARTAWVENFMENSQRVQDLVDWLETIAHRPVTETDVLKGLKIMWASASFAYSLWDLLDGEDYYDGERAALSLLSIGASYVAGEAPSRSRWWTAVILQLGSTAANVTALLKTRPAGCPSAQCGC